MAAPAVNIQNSIAVSIPIILSTFNTLRDINTTFPNQELQKRGEMISELALFSATGKPIVGTIVPATIDPLNVASANADAALAAAKHSDVDYATKKGAAIAAHEAVVAYYVSVFSA